MVLFEFHTVALIMAQERMIMERPIYRIQNSVRNQVRCVHRVDGGGFLALSLNCWVGTLLRPSQRLPN